VPRIITTPQLVSAQVNKMMEELYEKLGGPLNASQHVELPEQGGNDNNNGRSQWAAKESIDAAIAALPLVGSGGTAHRSGVVHLPHGRIDVPRKILYASEIVFVGKSVTNTDGVSAYTRGGTVLRMPGGFNDDMFTIDPAYTDWAHFAVFKNIAFEGDRENQAGFGVTRFLDDDNSTTLAFNAAGKTITRSGGNWITGGYTAGQVIGVTGTVNNNGKFTIAAGGVAATVLTVDEALTDESAINGCAVWPSPYNFVNITRPGVQTFFDNCFFRNAPSFGVETSGAVTNLSFHNCGGAKCNDGFAHVFYPDTGNLMNFTLSGTTQIDDCGPAPFFFEDRGDGGVNIANIETLECESVTEEQHMAIVRYHKIDGNNPMAFRIGMINAFRSGGLGAGTAVVHEMTGGAARWNIQGGLFPDNYTDEFRSDHRNFSASALSGQQSGQPILFGLHAGPRVSQWFGKVQLISGPNDPEGTVTAVPGTYYLRDNPASGAEAVSVMYVKLTGSGNTGWAPLCAVQTILTASLPAAGASQNNRLVIEDTGATPNFIVYGDGARVRFTGTSF
jgi:hypothetical protein